VACPPVPRAYVFSSFLLFAWWPPLLFLVSFFFIIIFISIMHPDLRRYADRIAYLTDTSL
jgi:hypothetical protein